jgi:hypothetical protein
MLRWRAASSLLWLPLRQLFDAFADIRAGLSKMTKALRPKRPALVPMLDTVVQKYLQDDDLGAQAPFGERAPRLVRGLGPQRGDGASGPAELARRSYGLTGV